MSRIERIKNIFARQVFDSRGNPTIYTRVELLEGHAGVSIVPSGASTGSKEALELRDNEEEFYNGKSVKKAVNNINEVICNELKNRDIDSQRQIDNKLIELDGTENKDNLGANSILGVSMAFARAAAASNQQELHFYLREQLSIDSNSEWEKLWEPRHGDGKWLLRKMMPVPMFNVLNGGSHAFNSTDFQEYMIVPIGIHDDIENSMHCGFKIYNELKKILESKNLPTTVGDEGGFSITFGENNPSNIYPLELLMEAIEKSNYEPGKDVMIALDVAASEMFKGKSDIAKRAMPNDQAAFADCSPFHLISTESMLDLNRRLPANASCENPVSIFRFRPNIEVECAKQAYDEDKWMTFNIGKASFRQLGPTGRCVIPTTSPMKGKRYDDEEPRATLMKYRPLPYGDGPHGGPILGIWMAPQANVEQHVTIGDVITEVGNDPMKLKSALQVSTKE